MHLSRLGLGYFTNPDCRHAAFKACCDRRLEHNRSRRASWQLPVLPLLAKIMVRTRPTEEVINSLIFSSLKTYANSLIIEEHRDAAVVKLHT